MGTSSKRPPEQYRCNRTNITINFLGEKKNETNQSIKSERHNFVSIVGDNSRMCRGVLDALSDCGSSDIHLHIVDVSAVRRNNGRTKYLVE